MNWLAHARITSVSAPLAFGCGSHGAHSRTISVSTRLAFGCGSPSHHSRTPNQWVLASDFPAAAAA